ncbi:hypothetical protein ILUMI_20664 [Ignelater luminosus]|uniref:Uncharacterized protein n=1 Tax=Ignelater luminosus TaxID=2038154 RepID=A0A8K0CG04_IGNLU|nr:hypothetical protein ILUMI_20664 [Ignelater luminosus]
MYGTFINVILLITVLNGCKAFLGNGSISASEENSLLIFDNSTGDANTTTKTLKDEHSELTVVNQSSTLTGNENNSLAFDVDKQTINVQKDDLSRIIVFIPQDAENNNLLFNTQELNFVKKIKNLLLSFLLFASENRVGSGKYGKSRIHERDVGDFLKKATDTVIETSKKVINSTRKVVKTVESNVKRIVTRNATFFSDIKNETAINAHICHEHCKDSTNKTTNTSENMTTDIIHTPNDYTLNKTTKIKLPLNSESSTSKPIDRNTKYFFGEESLDETPATTNSQNRIKRDKPRADMTKKLKRHISRKKCKQGDSECTNNRIKKEAVQSHGNKTEDKPVSTSATDKHVVISKTNSTEKRKQDFFMYKDWLLQHLESVKNGSLKSNSTKDLLKTHHFLFNSGGTEKSATDASETFAIISTNASQQKLAKQTLKNENSAVLKRRKRVKRQVIPSVRPKKRKTKLKPARASGVSQEQDQEVTLPNDDYDDYNDETTATTNPVPTITTHSSEDTTNTVRETEKTISSSTDISITKTTTKAIITSTSITKNELETTDSHTQEEEELVTTEIPTTIISTTNEKLNANMGKQHQQSTVPSLFDVDEHELKTMQSGRLTSATKKQKIQSDLEKQWNDGGGIRTKPLLLLVTIPSFIGIGVFILALCFLTRSGGWCCQLFEAQHSSQISMAKETQDPSVSHRPLRH